MGGRGWTVLVTTLLAVTGASGCSGDDGGAGSVPVDGPVRHLVVDTDLASDDLVALAFLLSSPRADVRAVTVSGTGEVRCPQGVDIVRGLLTLTGDEEIPVACGGPTPLAGDHAFPTDWRDAADGAWGLDLPQPVTQTGPVRTTVSDLLAEHLGDGETSLLTLGPLTNVADAFRTHPDLPRKVASIVVMGGAVDVAGNVFLDGAEPAPAEWNIYVDPTAAAEVVASGAPVTLVGLDATNQVPVTGDFVEALRDGAGSGAAGVAADLLEGNPMVASGEAFFWDPLAAAVALEPGLVDTDEMTISVVTDEGPDSGRTAQDEDGDPVAVATDADGESLEQLLLATLTDAGSSS